MKHMDEFVKLYARSQSKSKVFPALKLTIKVYSSCKKLSYMIT